MASNYTDILRLELPTTGELDATWGSRVNLGITALVETAIAGTANIAHDDSANYTLTTASGAADEARAMFLNVTGALGAARNVVCPTKSKLYFIKNATTGGFAVTLKTTAGTGISVPNGKYMMLYCDGTNVVDAVNYMSALALGTVLAGGSGGTGVDNSTRTITYAGNVAFTGAYNVSFTMPGAYTYTFPSATSTLLATNGSGSALTFSGTSVLALGGNLTTSGAYAVQFTIPGAYTYTFPGATSTLAILGANTFTGAQNVARATVASHATTADIWSAAGNQIDWTGTETTTIFPNAPQAGAERVLICAGACSFTAGANMLIDGVASAATVTCAANDQVIVRAVSTTQFKLSRIKYDGTAQVVAAAGFTLGTPVATTSGTAIDFTGIPAGTKQIVVLFNHVSTNGTSKKLIQIGDAGGVEVSGYSSISHSFITTVVAGSSNNVGFLINSAIATDALWGSVRLNLENAATFAWTASGVLSDEASSNCTFTVSGGKSLSDVLDRIRITTIDGTDTFDSGEVNIAYI